MDSFLNSKKKTPESQTAYLFWSLQIPEEHCSKVNVDYAKENETHVETTLSCQLKTDQKFKRNAPKLTCRSLQKTLLFFTTTTGCPDMIAANPPAFRAILTR